MKLIIILYLFFAVGLLFAKAPALTGKMSYEYEDGPKKIKHYLLEFLEGKRVEFQQPEKGEACAEVARELLNKITNQVPSEIESIKTSYKNRIAEFVFSNDDELGEVNIVIGGELAGKKNPDYFQMKMKNEKNVFGFNDITGTAKAEIYLEGIFNKETAYVQRGSVATNEFKCKFN